VELLERDGHRSAVRRPRGVGAGRARHRLRYPSPLRWRQILDVLAGGERPVNDLVRALGLPQPQVSKHLRVLREVKVVDVRDEGRRRLYRLNGHALKPIHDWVKSYERTWSERFDQLDVVLEELKRKEEGDGSDE
jgi:DNA-binding transcriptional ArsR family regulator